MQRQNDRQRLIAQRIDSAVHLMDEGEYEEADKKFVSVLKMVKSVPSDLTFYFGKNSFMLKKNRQSVDWLNKYIQLKGTTGKFSEEAIEWKKKAETELLKEQAVDVQQVTAVLSRDFDIDCGPTGKVICPVCNGSTVVIKKGYIGDTYKTCGYCNHTGKLSCEDYNKLLRGQLNPSSK